MNKKIFVWNRKEQKLVPEIVVAESLVQKLYTTSVGKFLEESIFSKAWISQLVGWFQSQSFSKRSILKFIKKFNINMQEYEEKKYISFNEFFIRKFCPESRSFVTEDFFPGFAEGRYLGYQTSENQILEIKGKKMTLDQILGPIHKDYPNLQGGPVFVARLCPLDYHRFHFFDDSLILSSHSISGSYHSVNPWALSEKTFCLNERKVMILQTKNFGQVAYVPVGALAVGKIILTHLQNKKCFRGEEAGYFLFGASTVIVLGQKEAWQVDQDLIEKTKQGIESFVCLGEKIGQVSKKN